MSVLMGLGVVFHTDFFVKLYFEIVVDQQTKAHDRTFEGVPDFGCPPVPAGQPRSCLVNFLAQFSQITLTCSKPYFIQNNRTQ